MGHPGTQQVDGPGVVLRVRRPLQHHRAAAVGHKAAVELAQRVRDHARAQHVLDRQRFAGEGFRVVGRPRACGGGDVGQVLPRRAELVQVARGGQAIAVDRVADVELRLERHRLGGRPEAPGGPLVRAIGDQCGVDQAGIQQDRGVQHVGHERRAADVRTGGVDRDDAQMLGQRHRAHRVKRRRSPDAVDIGDRQPRVLQRHERRLAHQLGRVPAGRLALAEGGRAGAGDLAAQVPHVRRHQAASHTTAGSPFTSSILARTFRPIVTSSGGMPTTRDKHAHALVQVDQH